MVFFAFNDIQSDYYQIPTADKERIKSAEEKIREDLKSKSNYVEQDTKETGPSNINGEDVKNQNLDDDIKKKEYREELKNTYGIKRYRIQEVIKPGQVILVQVLKEERGQKGSALTTFISLAGKYSINVQHAKKGGGISRKIFVFR